MIKYIFLFFMLAFPILAHSAAWEEVPNTKLEDYRTPDLPTTGDYFDFPGIMEGWSGGVLDTTENRLLIRGGGHSTYKGNEIYGFDFDTLTWSVAAPPQISGITTIPEGSTPLGATHTYDRHFYNAVTNELCDPAYSAAGSPNGYMYCYALDGSKIWRTVPNIYQGDSYAGEVIPGTNIFMFQSVYESALGQYNMTTEAIVAGPYSNVMSLNVNKNAIVDPDRNLFVLFFDNLDTYSGENGGVYAIPIGSFTGNEYLNSYKVTTSGTGPTDLGNLGVAYDPVAGDIVAIGTGEGDKVFHLDTETWTWTSEAATGAYPTALQNNGTFGRFQYVSSLDKFVLVNATNENVRFLDLRPETEVTTFNLTSAITDTSTPFTTAVGFKKGDVPSGHTPTLNLSNYQVEIKKYWNDGSVKHAIFSGTYDSTADTPTTITVYDGGTPPTGTGLTEADIVTAAPTASIDFDTYGSVSLSSLLGSPDRTWISGQEMVEAHYSANVGADPALVAKFYVRLYSTGDLWIRAIAENGTLDTANVNKTYTPTITIGGNVVYNNGGTDLTHYSHTRYSATKWINTTDPETTVAHDTSYLQESELVPNYWKTGPSEATLDALYQITIPMNKGGWSTSMGAGGFANQIGLLPLWDALYINSGGDSRAYNSVLANTEALNSYPIVWNDSSTNSPILISSFPTWTLNGAGAGGAYSWSAGPLTWELNHHGSGGYLAYLITGDYYYLETMEYQGNLMFLCIQAARGNGTDRLIYTETRGVAWATRTLGQSAGISPTTVASDQGDLLNWNANWWRDRQITYGNDDLGYFFTYGAVWPGTAYGNGDDAPWMHHFWMQAMGYASDLEPLADMTNFNAARDHYYAGVVGILGGNGADNFCFTKAGDYKINISSVNTVDPSFWHDTWGEVYIGTYGVDNTTCGNTLEQPDPSRAATAPAAAAEGQWGNLLPAIAYAVEDGATGAADSWARLTGATNWSEIENAGFESTPIWGIYPRSVVNPGIIKRYTPFNASSRSRYGATSFAPYEP